MANSNGSTGLYHRRKDSISGEAETIDREYTKSNGHDTAQAPQEAALVKYRHIAAVHSMPRTSCLSHDSETAPSFLGFRNLMVIVLGALPFASITSIRVAVQ